MIPPELRPDRSGLYIHVPYCAGKCGYCAFHSKPLTACPESEPVLMVAATLGRARSLAARFKADSFSSAFIGGGTPTALGPDALRGLLAGVAALGGDTGFLEWTVEANPESLSEDMFRILSDSGVDRISLGYQSGQERALRAAGRCADPAAGIRALDLTAAVWKGRLSVDLIIGLPGQDPEGVRTDIARAVAAGAEHLSVYGLTVEEGTPLQAAVGDRSIILPSEDVDSELWSAVRDACSAAGFERYEVSNWARPGAECRHNLNYWRGGAWIGAGPSAVSSVPLADGGTLRIQETRDHEAYLRDAGASAEEEYVRPALAAFEAVMTAFRTREGLDAVAFRNRFGADPELVLSRTFEKWAAFLEAGSRGPAPSDRLLDILNPFLLDCMEEMEKPAFSRGRSPGGDR